MWFIIVEDVKVTSKDGAKVFFFPDENLPLENSGKPLPQVTSELGDITYLSNKSSDTDEEFCFLGDEAGVGIMVSQLFQISTSFLENFYGFYSYIIIYKQ